MARRGRSKKTGGSKSAKRVPPCLWYLYVVECADGSFYAGIAKDVGKRVCVHNSGRGAKYTARRLPVRLVYSEVRADAGEALRREREIKRWSRPQKIERLGLVGPARLRKKAKQRRRCA